MTSFETLREILGLPLDDLRRSAYNANSSDKRISEVEIDGNIIRGYKAFSFVWEKTLVEEPKRSGNLSMGNIDDIASGVTPHLQIDFSLLFIDDYRTIMQLLYSRNQHTVTNYDIVNDCRTTNKMYFATEQMPKLYTLTKRLQGYNDNAIELFGVQDYTVELIGTNNEVEEIEVTYKLNPPSDVEWNGEVEIKETFPKYNTIGVGDNAILSNNGNSITIRDITFSEKYVFQYWCVNENGQGLKYIDGDEYYFNGNKTLYAIWKSVEV